MNVGKAKTYVTISSLEPGPCYVLKCYHGSKYHCLTNRVNGDKRVVIKIPMSNFSDDYPELELALGTSCNNYNYRGVHNFNSVVHMHAEGEIMSSYVINGTETAPIGDSGWNVINDITGERDHVEVIWKRVTLAGQEFDIAWLLREGQPDKYHYDPWSGSIWCIAKTDPATGSTRYINLDTKNGINRGWVQLHSTSSDDGAVGVRALLREWESEHFPTATWTGGYSYGYQAIPNANIATNTSIATLVSKAQGNLLSYDGKFKYFSLQGESWGYLCHQALQDIGLCNNNGLAYVKDAAEIAKTAVGVATNIRGTVNKMIARGAKARTCNKVAKELANAYLSTHYGAELSYRDTKEYLEALRKAGLNGGYTSHIAAQSSFTCQGWQVAQRYHLFYDSIVEDEKLLYEFLSYLDLKPSLENAWDMVPYSFVIDWFLHIGDALNAIDNYSHIQTTYNTICSCRSIKAVRQVTAEDLQLPEYCNVRVSNTYYGRAFNPPNATIPLPWGSSSPSGFNHYLEAGSLIVQRLP